MTWYDCVMTDLMTPDPMRRRRKDERPAEIIAAAVAEFAAKGFAAAKLEDVAKRAGVSKATIYVYYKDKQALFEACMKSQVGPLMDTADQLIDAFPGSTKDLLKLLIATIYQNLVKSDARQLLRIIIGESENFPFLAEMHYKQSVSKGEAIISKIIARGIARGEFREGAYAKVPIVVVGPAIMATVWTLIFQRYKPLDLDEVLEAHVDLILNGISSSRE
jgi:AcrR family transcriptional regulator